MGGGVASYLGSAEELLLLILWRSSTTRGSEHGEYVRRSALTLVGVGVFAWFS